jgi:hypothetical protein
MNIFRTNCFGAVLLGGALLGLGCRSALGADIAPPRTGYYGEEVPPEVELMYTKGLTYLVKNQTPQGTWPGQYGNEPASVALAILAMLAHGEDPNNGPYAMTIKKGLNYILQNANNQTGYMGGPMNSMYNHGFATLALAEAYGVVDDPRLGPALEKAVALIVNAQARNSRGAWRYSPETTDADTTVSGAQMVALFAARNAGIGVPDAVMKRGLDYYVSCQAANGTIGYTQAESGGRGPTTAIGALVFALAKWKDKMQYKSAIKRLQEFGAAENSGYEYYYLYYASQAFFQGTKETWDMWNAQNIKRLAARQGSDGSWSGNMGALSTPAALLSLALNYRFLPIYER